MFKKLLLFTGISFALIMILLAVGIFVLSKYAKSLEKQTGLSSTDDTSQQLLIAPPDRALPGDLDLFSPVTEHVYGSKTVSLEGKAKSDSLLLTINFAPPELLKTAKDGRFKKDLTLLPGVSKIGLFFKNKDHQIVRKELTIGYDPSAVSTEQFALLGMVENLNSKTGTFSLAGTEIWQFALPSSAKIFKGPQDAIQPISFSGLDNEDLAGIIATKDKNDNFVPSDIRAHLYPYFLYGFIRSITENSLTLERDKKGSNPITLNLLPTTKIQINKNSQLQSGRLQDLQVGQEIYAPSYVTPKENRSNFFVYSITVL